MGKHTKEPWVLFEVGDRHVHFCPGSKTDKTSILTVTEEDGVSFAAVYSDDDARRIVACVNACAGIPTDDLEASPDMGLFHLAEFSECLLQQRNELQAALEVLVGDISDRFDMDSPSTNPGMKDAVSAALEAIAKSKGGAA